MHNLIIPSYQMTYEQWSPQIIISNVKLVPISIAGQISFGRGPLKDEWISVDQWPPAGGGLALWSFSTVQFIRSRSTPAKSLNWWPLVMEELRITLALFICTFVRAYAIGQFLGSDFLKGMPCLVALFPNSRPTFRNDLLFH